MHERRLSAPAFGRKRRVRGGADYARNGREAGVRPSRLGCCRRACARRNSVCGAATCCGLHGRQRWLSWISWSLSSRRFGDCARAPSAAETHAALSVGTGSATRGCDGRRRRVAGRTSTARAAQSRSPQQRRRRGSGRWPGVRRSPAPARRRRSVSGLDTARRSSVGQGVGLGRAQSSSGS